METAISAEVEDRLRKYFKYMNRAMVLSWRLGLGGLLNDRRFSGQIMVLTHIGRKSGAKRYQPLNYAFVDDELYCIAGFGAVSDWYRNILANPNIEVWLPEGWWVGTARDVSDSPNRLKIMRQLLIASGFAARAFGVDPQTLTEEDLDQATAKYRVVNIQRSLPRTGRGGPGDLSWLWPISTLVFAFLWLFFPRRRR